METNVNFLLSLCNHKEFASGNVYTNFINDYHESLFSNEQPTDSELMQAALAMVLKENYELTQSSVRKNDCFNPFIVESGFRINHHHQKQINMKFKDSGSFK